MKSIPEKETLSFIFACTCVIILPIYVWYIPPFMVLWGLSRILECRTNRIHHFRLNSYPTWLFILFMVFYFWQLIGIIYSDNVKTGWNIFFSRFSLFLFPFVLVIPGEKILNNVKLLLKLFAGSTTLFILCCFVYAFYKSISFQNGILIFNQHPPEGHWLSYFYGSYFSINQHPSYLSMYVIVSIFIAFESWFDKNQKIHGRVAWLMIGVFLLISIYFLSSRSGILTIVLFVPIYFFYKLKGKVKVKWKGLIIVLSILVIIFVLFPIIRSNERVKIGIDAISNGSIKQNAIKDGRVIIWRSALRIIRSNLIFGVGIGDVKTELMKEYQKVGDQDLIENKYNVHNQFLEVLLENGIIGLLFFLLILGYMLSIMIYEKNLLYGLFLMMMFIFFMFETVLYRLAGISFFSLFSFLLLHLNSFTRPYFDQ
jgi:O-antigen ligase